jgi:hypothetical protein
LSLALSWALGSLLWGCLYDDSERCTEGMDLADGICVCPENTVLAGERCLECGDDEEARDGVCVCQQGFARTSAGGCSDVPAGLLEDCSDADCPDDGADTCVTDDDGSYCSVASCESALDCPAEFGCDLQADPPLCVRPPRGLGEPCTSAADCEGFEAQHCETFQSHVCVVNDCAANPSVCHGDWACCDFAILGESLCIPPGELDEEGACPLGNAPVEE